MLKDCPTPARKAAAAASGSVNGTNHPLAFWCSSSAMRNVLSPAEPPPILSPVSNKATGNLALAMACATAWAGSGRLSIEFVPRGVEHVGEALRFAPGKLGIVIGDNYDTRSHGEDIAILIAAGDTDRQDLRIFFQAPALLGDSQEGLAEGVLEHEVVQHGRLLKGLRGPHSAADDARHDLR